MGITIIRWIIALPIIVGAVLFALAHPDPVSVTWNPLEPAVELPLYFVSLVFLAVGFLLGAFVAWLGMGKVRKERRQQRKTIKKLEKDINTANEKVIDILTKYKPANGQALTQKAINDDDTD